MGGSSASWDPLVFSPVFLAGASQGEPRSCEGPAPRELPEN